jgi:hypothetical protein
MQITTLAFHVCPYAIAINPQFLTILTGVSEVHLSRKTGLRQGSITQEVMSSRLWSQ